MSPILCTMPGCQTTAGCICDRSSRPSFFTRWEKVIKGMELRPRQKTPTMEQDDEVAAVAREIYSVWMRDPRFQKTGLPYFWAELAARAVKHMEAPLTRE